MLYGGVRAKYVPCPVELEVEEKLRDRGAMLGPAGIPESVHSLQHAGYERRTNKVVNDVHVYFGRALDGETLRSTEHQLLSRLLPGVDPADFAPGQFEPDSTHVSLVAALVSAEYASTSYVMFRGSEFDVRLSDSPIGAWFVDVNGGRNPAERAFIERFEAYHTRTLDAVFAAFDAYRER